MAVGIGGLDVGIGAALVMLAGSRIWEPASAPSFWLGAGSLSSFASFAGFGLNGLAAVGFDFFVSFGFGPSSCSVRILMLPSSFLIGCGDGHSMTDSSLLLLSLSSPSRSTSMSVGS